jgi:mRNA interferase MazF
VSEILQGDVYWIDFGPTSGSALLNATPVSNLNRARAPGNVALKKGDGNLPRESVVNVSQVLTTEKSDLVEWIGRLPPSAIDAVRNGLQLLFDRA